MENKNLNNQEVQEPKKDKDTSKDFSSAELAKKPLWFLFLAANVIIIIGCAITFALGFKGKQTNLWIPTLVCNILGIALAALFLVFEIRDIAPKMMHFQKKWLTYYLIAFCFFVLAILFNAIYFLVGRQEFVGVNKKIHLSIYLVITGVLSLISIGFQRYSRFKIDLDIYRRKHGIIPGQKEEKKEEKPVEVKTDKPVVEPTKEQTASGSLLDQMDK